MCLWLPPSLEQKVEEKREGEGRERKKMAHTLHREGQQVQFSSTLLPEDHSKTTQRLSPEYGPFAPAGSRCHKLLQFIVPQQPAIDSGHCLRIYPHPASSGFSLFGLRIVGINIPPHPPMFFLLLKVIPQPV